MDYTITTDGRVFNKFNRELKPQTHKGYLYVTIYDNERRKFQPIHKLVAQAHIQNPCNLPEVNHIDGNKMNNNVSNLEWCTGEHNIAHRGNPYLYIISDKNDVIYATESLNTFCRNHRLNRYRIERNHSRGYRVIEKHIIK